MGLTKLGSLIQIREERNDADFNLPFYGININKEFMPSVANTDGVDRKKYKIVRKNKFVFSGMQTGRDVCIRIGLYTDDEPVLVSPAYTTFEVTSPLIIPTYLFMIFCSKEKDRLGWFLSDSSVRSNLDWDRFCGIQIDLPSIEIQKKYVDIYNSLIDNLKIFEKGSDDLSLICDGTIEKWRKESSSPIGSRLIESHEINSQSEKLPELGVSISKTLINTKAVSSDQTNQKIVRPGRFVYVTVTSRNGGACSIALDRDILCSVSSSYCTFDVTKDLYPPYLDMWFKRKEFNRFARFHSWGTTREVFPIEAIENYRISIPNIEKQISVAKISDCLLDRQKIVARLKSLIWTISPILIKGSVEEEHRGKL